MQASKYRSAGEYPCGMASFSNLRQRGCVYVDKTDLVYEMTSQIIKVGAYFDVKERTLKDWKVEELDRELN